MKRKKAEENKKKNLGIKDIDKKNEEIKKIVIEKKTTE